MPINRCSLHYMIAVTETRVFIIINYPAYGRATLRAV